MDKRNTLDWVGSGALKDFADHLTSGGSYKDFLVTLRDKYGIVVSVARLSQVKKRYLIDKIAQENV